MTRRGFLKSLVPTYLLVLNSIVIHIFSFVPTSTFHHSLRNRETIGYIPSIPIQRRQNQNPIKLHSLSERIFLRAHNNKKSSKLFSLNNLIHTLENSESTNQNDPRVVFVGGKGGVGKTTISSSIAVTLATSYESNNKILIVSTDPAHSLGDALDCDLRSASGKVMPMTDPMTANRLYACEVDPTTALEELKSNLSAFNVDKLADALGVSPSLLDSLGLSEFSNVLNNPPPGLDELVALSNVLASTSSESSYDFDTIIVDTAPTGHTLRLLQLPQFLDGLLGKLLELRMKLSGLASTLQAFFGSEEAAQRTQTLDNAVEKLESFRTKMSNMRERLQDSSKTSFVVVTVPTKLGAAESKRLMSELSSQNVLVTDLVVNQCVNSDDDSDAMMKYYERRKAGQTSWINTLQESIDSVSNSDEYKSNGNGAPIALSKIPYSDIELVGVPALAYLAKTSFIDNPSFSYLMENNSVEEEAKFVICGGKGGVGKTTTSSALAVSMAGTGHNVALISTDPAHSLGDALGMDISGGDLIDCPLIGMPPTEGTLSVMEVDPSAALGQFKTLIDNLIGSATQKSFDSNESGGLGSALSGLGEIFDTLPPGTDEVVALAKVVGLLKKGGYDRIVLDTAPTGHTLRMLSTPGFLADLIDRVLDISKKINSNSMVKMLISSGGNTETVEATVAAASSALLSFQLQMYDLEDLFANADQTEFLIVTVPTELAVRESVRLLNDLTFDSPDMPIKVRNVVANQVLSDGGDDVEPFLARVESGQKDSIEDLRTAIATMNERPEITEVHYLDTEPRGVYGLKALSYELLGDNN